MQTSSNPSEIGALRRDRHLEGEHLVEDLADVGDQHAWRRGPRTLAVHVDPEERRRRGDRPPEPGVQVGPEAPAVLERAGAIAITSASHPGAGDQREVAAVVERPMSIGTARPFTADLHGALDVHREPQVARHLVRGPLRHDAERGHRCPATPLITSATVPSPPTATTARYPSRAARRASSRRIAGAARLHQVERRAADGERAAERTPQPRRVLLARGRVQDDQEPIRVRARLRLRDHGRHRVRSSAPASGGRPHRTAAAAGPGSPTSRLHASSTRRLGHWRRSCSRGQTVHSSRGGSRRSHSSRCASYPARPMIP
jgi:hypothetical protein